MVTTPPPLPKDPPPPGFRLHPSAFIAWGAYAALRMAFLFVRKEPVTAYGIGELIGGAVALLAICMVLAMIGWRIGGRSSKAGTGTFFAMFGLFLLGQLSQFAGRVQAGAELSRINEEQKQVVAEQRAAVAQGRPLDTGKSEKLIAQAGSQLDEMAKNSTGRERVMAEAGKTYMDDVLVVKHRYDAAVKSLGADNFWNLATYATPTAANDRRRDVRALAQANTELATFQDVNGTALRRVMAVHGASDAEVQSAIAGYLSNGPARLLLMMKIRECDAQLAQTMLEFIDFAEANRGKWQLNAAGKIVFHDPAAPARYNELLKRVHTLIATQSDCQKQVLAAKP